MKKLLLSLFYLLSPISISGISNLSIISPYNFIGIFLFLFLFLKKKIKINFSIIFFIFMSIESLIINFNKTGLLLPLSLMPIFYEDIFKTVKISLIKRYINWHFYILFLILGIDLIYRFQFDILNIFSIIKSFILADGKINFYYYKVNSILFNDTNYTAVFIGIGLLFYIHLEKYKITNKSFYKLYLLILFFLTFSRTAYIALVLCFFYKRYLYVLKKYKFLKIIGIVFVILILSFFSNLIFEFFMKDGSFRSKIYILEQFCNYLKSVDIFPLIFGVGFGRSYEFLGIYGHSSLIVFFVEGGILFFLAFINLCYFLWKKYRGERDILIFTFLCTISATQYNYIYLIIILSTLHMLKKMRLEIK